MQFSDTTNKNGLIQDCESIIFGDAYGVITSDTNLLATFTRLVNRAYDRFATIVFTTNGRWQWDDTNYTDMPIGATDLVNGQKEYVLDLEHLKILKVLVKDSAGNKMIARPIDINDREGRAMYEEAPTAVEGIPIMYDKFANILRLYPVPNYDSTGGLIVHYQRQPNYFVSSDTTKIAGIPAIFHRYLSLVASMDYAVQKQMAIKNDLATIIQQMESDIKNHFAGRSGDESLILKGKFRYSR